MSRPIKLALRFLAIVAVVALIPATLGPSSSRNSPYLSALSDLTAGSALAAPPGCAQMACNAPDNCVSAHNKPTKCGLSPIGGCATFHC